MKYDFSKLWSAQFFAFYKFKHFYEYTSDKDYQINYYKQFSAIHADTNGISEIETPQEMIDYYFEENESVLEMIKNQLIFFLFT